MKKKKRENELKLFKHKHHWEPTISIVWQEKSEYYPFESELHKLPIERLCVKCGLVQHRDYYNYICNVKSLWRYGLLETYAWRDRWETYNSLKDNKRIETKNYDEIMNE